MGPSIIVGCWLLGLILAAMPAAPRWSAWISPVTLAVVFVVAYERERSATSGDSQPGLVMIVGLGSVAVATVLVVIGLLVRDRREGGA